MLQEILKIFFGKFCDLLFCYFLIFLFGNCGANSKCTYPKYVYEKSNAKNFAKVY